MKFFKWRPVSILVLFCSFIFISTSDVYAARGEVAFAQYDALVEKASDEGSVKVIVRLVVPDLREKTEASRSFRVISPGQVFSSDALQADLMLAKAIHTTADSVVQALDPNECEINHTYSTVPFLALDASLKGLSTLRSLPSVADIVEDRPMELTEMKAVNDVSADDAAVSDNLKVIGADVAWSKGYTGSGWYVAILDSGIRATHEMFKGKNIVEACFSACADCPNKGKEMTGSGAAAHYYDYSSVDPAFDHGTHVAGIAAGNSGTVFGVAKDADIIAVQVCSRLASGADPLTSDMLKGLEYVYTIRGSYTIASVNMSLGGGYHDAYCDDDELKPAVDNLREAGIATVISSGNKYWCGAVGSPACISSSVSIGATNNDDQETDFSNWHPSLVDFFAPGYQIYSARAASDNSYEAWDGTSMAAPHVAGAWAIMKQCKKDGNVTELYYALKETGKSVNSRCGSGSRPRINVGNAIPYLQGILPAPTLSVAVDGTKVTASWSSVPTAQSYVLFYGSNPDFLLEGSHQISMGGKTTVTADLPVGTLYYVAVKAYNDAGSSDYSNVEEVNVTANIAGAVSVK